MRWASLAWSPTQGEAERGKRSQVCEEDGVGPSASIPTGYRYRYQVTPHPPQQV